MSLQMLAGAYKNKKGVAGCVSCLTMFPIDGGALNVWKTMDRELQSRYLTSSTAEGSAEYSIISIK